MKLHPITKVIIALGFLATLASCDDDYNYHRPGAHIRDDRRENRQDWRQEGRENRQDFRQDHRENRQDWRQERREYR